MATHTITIYATNELPTPLTISDDEGNRATTAKDDKNLTTSFKNGDTVKWVIDPNSNISSIDAITQATVTWGGHTGKVPIFRADPAMDRDGSWSALIELSGGLIGATQEYSISYTVNKKQYVQDPRLKINQ